MNQQLLAELHREIFVLRTRRGGIDFELAHTRKRLYRWFLQRERREIVLKLEGALSIAGDPEG